MRLQLKIVGLIVLVVLASGVLSMLAAGRLLKNALDDELREKAVVLSLAVSELIVQDIIDGDYSRAGEALRKIVQRSKDADYAYVVGFDGRIAAYTFERGFPRSLFDLGKGERPSVDDAPVLNRYFFQGHKVLDVSSPLIKGMAARVHIGMNQRHVLSQFRSLLRDLALIGVIVTGLGVVLSLVLSQRITRPLAALAQYIQSYGRGQARGDEPPRLKSSALEIRQLAAAFARMISQREEAEKALRESEARFRSLAENSSDWIWEFDENECFTYASPRIQDLLGYAPEEVVGTSAFDLIPLPDRERVAEEFMAVKAGRERFALLENVNRHQDGRLLTLESSGVPIFDDNGDFRGYRGINRDVTERKRLEAQLRQAQKMEAIGTLAGGIAHDFNNILAAILGYAELARDDIPPANPARQKIGEVLKAGLRAKDLVQHILSFSRKSEPPLKPTIISAVVKEAVKLLRATIPSTIEIRLDVAPDCGVVLADSTRIHQVLMNLCSNAAQAMEETGGVLEVGLANSDPWPGAFSPGPDLPAGPYVRLTVADTGPGIGSEIKNQIFDPYFTTKGVGRGSGLGLAVVQGIVQGHGGAIRVESAPGQGARFQVFFPRVEGKAPEPDAAQDVLPTGRERILLVDDEKALAELGKQVLELLGYTVTAATDSIEALKAFRAAPEAFDLVITDQTMPNISGADLAGKLLAIRPDLPIILCTGYSSRVDKEKARAMGIRAFAMKPLGKKEMANLIRTVLGNRDAGLPGPT